MEPRDIDDRILDAIRSGADPPADADPMEQELLVEAERIGAAARRAANRPDGGDELEEPPAQVWEAIRARIASEAGPASGDAERSSGGDVVPITGTRRSRPWVVGLAAAAVAAIVVAVVGVVVTRDDDAGSREVATVALDPLSGAGSGSAVLVDEDGLLVLDVAIDGIQPGDGYLEVWLLDPDVTELVSLGPVRDDGRYQIPAGLDVAGVPVVDVSVESFDGDPGHSGDSVLRGVLPV